MMQPAAHIGLARSRAGDVPLSPAVGRSTGPSEDQAWRYGYDALGHQISQVPPVNQTATALSSRSWTYTPVGG